MAVISYAITIPSKGRTHNMGRMLSLLPNARVWVHHSEKEAYANVVPSKQLFLHDATKGLGQVRNWIREHTKEEALFMCDDDLMHIKSLAWRRPKLYRHPDAIQQVIENMVNMLADLDLPVGAWNSDQNPQWFKTTEPFHLCTHFGSAWVWRRMENRKYRIDDEIATIEDKDLMLQVLKDDRVFVIDRRWQFCFEPMKSGIGGLQAFRENDRVARDRQILKQRWKGNIMPRKGRGTSNTYLSLNVARKSPLGFRG